MAHESKITIFAILALGAAQTAVAVPPEPLVVTKLHDPDPNYVPPQPEPKAASRPRRNSDENPTLDRAFENLGRVTGQLAKMGEQHAKSNPNWEAEARARIEKLREEAQAPKN